MTKVFLRSAAQRLGIGGWALLALAPAQAGAQLFYEQDFEGQKCQGQVGVILSEMGHVTVSCAEQGKLPFFARITRSAMEAEMGREFDRALLRLEAKVTVPNPRGF